MSRFARAEPRVSRIRGKRPIVEALERREVPTTGSGVAFQSAYSLGSSGRNASIHANAVAIDPAGDTFVTGSFRGTVAFDPASSAATFTSSGTQDTFVVEYAPSGALKWARTFVGQATAASGGTTYAVGQGSAIAVDSTGNVFVSGSFSGTVNFGGNKTLSSPNGSEAFVARLDATGNLVWVANAVGNAADVSASAIALDGSGGAVIAGSFAQTANFGVSNLVAAGASEAFVARVDSLGRFTWASASRGSVGSNAGVRGVAVDPSGNVILSGYFSGHVNLIPTTGLDSAGSDDAAVWKLDSGGRPLWARSFGAVGFDSADAVAVDASGNSYVAGTFSDTVNFSTGPNADSLTSSFFDAYVLKLDPSGGETWVRGLVGPGGWARATGIALDPGGYVHVTGTFSGTVDFDPGPGTDNRVSVGSTDAFVAGLDASGVPVYALQAGQTNANSSQGVAANAWGSVVIAGSYSNAIAFGPTSLPSAGIASIFVARAFVPPRPLAPSAPILEPTSTTGTPNITSITSPIFDVNAVAVGNTVNLLRDGILVGQRVGPGAIRDPGPVSEGSHIYTAYQVTAGGVAGPPGPGTTVSFLLSPPVAPPAPTLLAADDSGVIGDGITRIRQPRLIGMAPAGLKIQVVNAANIVLGSAVATGGGSYSIAIASPLNDGSYSLGVRAIDAAGNIGGPSQGFALTILATPPPVPPAPALLALDNSGPPGGSITNVRSPRLVGSAQPGARVQLVGPTGTMLAIATASAVDGSYTAAVAAALADGTYAIRAVVFDLAGNSSTSAAAFPLTIDGTPPAGPSVPVLAAQDDSGTPGDGLTNVRQPRLTGQAEANATVQILDASGVVRGSAVAGPDGTFSVKIGTSLADAAYSLRARAIDAAGNVSAPGAAFSLVILATAPRLAAPSLLAADDTGTSGDGLTTVRRPRLVGTGVPGGKISWVGPDGSALATTTASTADGSYTLQLPTGSPNGIIAARVREVDVAGNVGPISSPFNLTVRAAVGDYFGDARTDVGIFRPGDNTFYLQVPRTGGLYAKSWAVAGDIPVTGDFHGEGHSDIAVYRPSNSTFYLFDPATSVVSSIQWGATGSIPVPADFDGDGKTDVAIFSPSGATFYVLNSSTNAFSARQLGANGDIPVPADYFGNGHADFAVYRPGNGTFYVFDPITGASKAVAWGNPGDVPMPADYFGDGKADIAVFRPGSDGAFIIQPSTGTAPVIKPFGNSGDVPVFGDYFGAGHANLAVYRPSTSTFYALDPVTGSSRSFQWGAPNTEKPISPTITAQFRATGTPAASSSHGGPAIHRAEAAILVPITPDPAAPIAPSRKAAAVDRAIDTLSLEGWRVAV